MFKLITNKQALKAMILLLYYSHRLISTILGKCRIHESYYGRTTRFLQPDETLEELSREGSTVRGREEDPPPKTPAEGALYARAAQRTAHPEGVEVEEEGRDEDLRTGESLMVEAATSHIVNMTHRTLGRPLFQFSSIYSKKRNKGELTIPLNPTNIPMSGIDSEVFLHCSDVGAVRTVLGFVDRAVGMVGQRLDAQPGWG
ncbi:hypothetical protein HOY80DRAFT_1052398 [Tuber brumale]|nr:hypothetical protein HOY80DRAFT_1052398 [Tuber brumale]